jgi:hypothetical protein
VRLSNLEGIIATPGLDKSASVWYDPSMFNAENLVGKPLVVYIDGQKTQIGTIDKAAIRSGNLYVGATLDLAHVESLPGEIFTALHES